MQVKEDIYTISERELAVTRYSNLQEDGSLDYTVTNLASLYVSREQCSAANQSIWAIYVTGGVGSDSLRQQTTRSSRLEDSMERDTTNSAYRYNLVLDEWTNLPSLNVSRRSHSSCFVQ